MVEFEADDGVLYRARKFRDAPGVEQVLICSPDKDLTQCVDRTKVVTLHRRRQIAPRKTACERSSASHRIDS